MVNSSDSRISLVIWKAENALSCQQLHGMQSEQQLTSSIVSLTDKRPDSGKSVTKSWVPKGVQDAHISQTIRDNRDSK